MMKSAPAAIKCDIAIIGAGIGGAGAAAFLAPHADVAILEAESTPGYHTTGRSAAFFAESYGGAAIRPLTSASKPFYLEPPAGFCDLPLVSERGALHVFAPGDEERAAALGEDLGHAVAGMRLVTRDELVARVPVLRPEQVAGALSDPECRDLDVAAIHQGFLRRARTGGARLLADARVTRCARMAGGWRITLADGRVVAAQAIVNAAGAWVDEVARMAGLDPLGFRPLRRTIVVFRPGRAAVDPGWPLIIDIDESFYFKPETGRILASPADETPSPPCDARPEEIDVATIVDRLERWTTLDVPRIENRWAGLRTFAPDRVPVVGEDPRAPGFFWCAGQGGYGIQTAPAMGRLTAALVLGRDLPPDLAAAGVEPRRYHPQRLLAEGGRARRDG